MIEKFNFYDIYGYVLPGTLLLGMFWLPFGIAAKAFPAQEISTTLLLLALAYVFGHILQNIASAVVPSMVRGSDGISRAYSDLVLDKDHPSLGPAIRKVLEPKVRQAFQLDIHADETGTPEISKTRNAAFFQARAYLIRQKAASYVEQFEGLYAMMRGLACSFFVGCAYLLGWGLSFHWQRYGLGAVVFLITALAIASSLAMSFTSLYLAHVFPANKQTRDAKKRADQGLAMSLLLAVMGAGYFLGTWQPAPARVEIFFWMACASAPIAGARCLSSYRAFALNFAETVWRNFSELYTPEKINSAPPAATA